LFYIVSSGNAVSLRSDVLAGHQSFSGMLVHWAGIVLLLALFGMVIRTIRANAPRYKDIIAQLSIFFVTTLVLIFSVELKTLTIFAFRHSVDIPVIRKQYDKAGLTILWAICSFAIMWLGMRHRVRPLRFVSLALFLLALLKLFLFDIAGLSEGGKIGAFILLGVLLLVISFMYQKLKRIIFDDQTNEEQP
jgi:uncharacterized membrane protein